MTISTHAPASPKAQKPGAADPLKQEACIQVVVRFVDGNSILRYSYDVQHRGKKIYQNVGYWTSLWQKKIEFETPPGWKGRVESAAIFHSFDGNRGDKICQFERRAGWTWNRNN